MKIFKVLFLGFSGLALSTICLLLGYFPFVPSEAGDQVLNQSITYKWFASTFLFLFALIVINLMLGYLSKPKSLLKRTVLVSIIYILLAGVFFIFDKNRVVVQMVFVAATYLVAILILPVLHTIIYVKNKSL